MTAGDVMNRAASLLNDTDKSTYTYVVQLPYLNTALDELAGQLEANNISYTNKETADLAVVAGVSELTSATTPAIPSDLVEIQSITERAKDSEDTHIPMVRCEFLPDRESDRFLGHFAWQGQALKFIAPTEDREIRIEYIANPLSAATGESSTISLINAKNFLAFRTASLCAMYIGENPTRASALDNDAKAQLDYLIRISVKGNQSIPTRRRPFRALFKARGW
jgi:hypothetical protein